MLTPECAISSEILERYWPLTEVRSGRLLQRTDGRIVREFCAAEGRFVYKIADVPRTGEIIEQDLYAYDFLRANGFVHAPALLKTRDGQRHHVLNDLLVYVLEFIEGTTPAHNQQK